MTGNGIHVMTHDGTRNLVPLPAQLVRFSRADGAVVLDIDLGTGKVTLGEGICADEAGCEAFAAFERTFREFIAAGIAAAAQKARA